jgi:hypothetical protein
MENNIDTEAKKLYEKLLPVLNEYIQEKQESKEPFDADMFLHILGNIIPTNIYASIQQKETVEFNDLIEFNHIANKLLFKYNIFNQMPIDNEKE